MKLNEKDIELFKTLSKSTLGRDLAEYLGRVEDYIYNSRSWKAGDTKESAEHAARTIRTLVTEKLIKRENRRGLLNESE